MPRKDRVLRFFVSDQHGRESPAWRVWITGKSSDVYFAHREIAGEMKGSLHQSGSWQWGLTSERARGPAIPGWESSDRHMKIWRRPSELSPGVTRAISIGVPTTELQYLPESPSANGAARLLAPPTGSAVEVTLLFCSDQVAHQRPFGTRLRC